MVFNSVSFLIFLAVMVSLYWVLPTRLRIATLAFGSVVFYCFWRVPYISIVLLSTLIDYFASLTIAGAVNRNVRRTALAASLFGNLGLLFYFKYLGFVLDNAQAVSNWAELGIRIPHLDIILPMGISFYTFQTMSYTIDVYRGFIKPERDFIQFLNYVMFFPQLVAGPILRASEVIEQLRERPLFSHSDFAEGLRRILMGLFLKCVIADNIAGFVDEGYSLDPGSLSGLDAWTLAFLFGFQIYFDFSAYSHIAIGCALLMGLHFPENFDFPYLACSPRDFWKRWHISLSSWIRDYLYLPLAGAKVEDRSTGGLAVAANASPDGRASPGAVAATRALFLSWVIMGLWHGANWTFAAWGLYQALAVYAYRLGEPWFRTLPAGVRTYGGWLVTLPTMMLGWLFFRSPSLEHAFCLVGKALNVFTFDRLGMRENNYLVAASLLVGVVLAFAIWTWERRTRGQWLLLKASGEVAWVGIACALVFVFLRPIQQFIYFQF